MRDDSEMSEAERAEARRYRRLGLLCTLLDKAIDLVFLAIFAAIFAATLDRWLEAQSVVFQRPLVRLIALFAVMMSIHVVISLPLTFYADYLLERQFGLSTLTPGRWLWRYLGRLGLAVGFGLVMIAGLFELIWNVGPYWWLAAAGAFFLVSVVLGQVLPVLILPLFYRVERLDVPELADRMRRLAEGTGLSIEGVYRLDLSIETVKANAMLAGLGRWRRVLLGDTLLEKFSPDEIDVIFAHEIGHHVFRHLPKMLAGGLVFSLAGLWACDRVLWLSTSWPGPVDYASLSPAVLPGLLLILSVFSFVSAPLQHAVSRAFERQCDRYALRRTGRPEAYRSAFHKLARLNKDDMDPPRWEVLLLDSHPPIRERLALADESRLTQPPKVG